jgi:hypothetical protein
VMRLRAYFYSSFESPTKVWVVSSEGDGVVKIFQPFEL